MRSMPLILSALLLACSNGSDMTSDSGPDVVATDSSPGMDSSPMNDATADAGAPTLSSVISFNAGAYELAEGLTFHDGKAYVGFAPTGTIVSIDNNGTRTDYAHVPAGGNDAYTLGLLFGSSGELYVLETKNDQNSMIVPGIYKIPANGGSSMTPFATDANFGFPNGLAFDGKGNLLVADSATGRILSVTPQGTVTTWKADPELAGSTACNAPLPFPIGANGIVFTPSAVFVSNTANGAIVKIAVDGSGNAGAVSTIVKDCKWVGFDGIALDKDGTLLAAINGAPGKFARVDMNGNVTVLASSEPLDGPASIAFADSWKDGKRYALITSSAFFSVSLDGGSPKPGLLQYGPLP